MAIAGPRLDRPSAVGAEGRPRATSLTVAAVVSVALAAVALGILGTPGVLGALGLAVALFVPGLALLNRPTVGEQVVGHAMYHPGAVLVVGVVLVATSTTLGLVAGGFFAALLGVAAAWADVLTRERLHEATRRAALSYVAVIGWTVGLAAAVVLSGGAWGLVARILATADPVGSLFGFLVVLAAVGFLVRVAVWSLPIVSLSARPRRAARRAAAGRLARAGTLAGSGALLAIFAGAVVGQRRLASVLASSPSIEALAVALSSAAVVGPLAILAAVCAVGTVVGLLAREVAAQVDAGNDDAIAAGIAGLFGTVFVVGTATPPVVGLLPASAGLVAVALLAPLVTILAGVGAVACLDRGLVPRRAAGPALATAGLLLAAVGVALAGLPAPLVFACVAGAMVVWDCGTFGQGLTVELGHRPETRRLELYHGVLSVGLGLATVAVATAIEWLRTAVGTSIGAWPAAGLAVVGAVVLAVAVRRRQAQSS